MLLRHMQMMALFFAGGALPLRPAACGGTGSKKTAFRGKGGFSWGSAAEDCFQLLQFFGEFLQGYGYGPGRVQVYAGVFQDIEGIIAAARMEETQVFFHSAGFAAQDGGGEGGGCGISGSVFVHVERRVEMGDAGPFAGQLLVGGQGGAVILPVAFQPVIFQLFGLQRAAGGNFAVDEFLELGELHLTVNGGPYGFQELVEQVDFLFIIGIF